MKLRFTHKDFLLILGIIIATVITMTTIANGKGFFSLRPDITKKIIAWNRISVSIHQHYDSFFKQD